MANPHVSPRWPGKLEKKIDLFIDGFYYSSTNAYQSCKKAAVGLSHFLGQDHGYKITAHYAK